MITGVIWYVVTTLANRRPLAEQVERDQATSDRMERVQLSSSSACRARGAETLRPGRCDWSPPTVCKYCYCGGHTCCSVVWRPLPIADYAKRFRVMIRTQFWRPISFWPAPDWYRDQNILRAISSRELLFNLYTVLQVDNINICYNSWFKWNTYSTLFLLHLIWVSFFLKGSG